MMTINPALTQMVLNEGIHQRTRGCEECKKEGTHWVALRLCLVCGHVGCCDSSIGLHGTKHHRETAHPVIMALPDKPWNGVMLIQHMSATG
ncbi:MAG: UBP-type zinc finger domain-containing protein [Candidatus Nitrosocosmicus sp.]